jgi:acetyl esterase/lipase
MEKGTVAELRRLYASGAAFNKPPRGTAVEGVAIGALQCEKLTSPGADPEIALLWLHGGGYALGSPPVARALAAGIAAQIGGWVLVPAYRQCPEHELGAGLEDALGAYRWLTAELGGAARIIVGGESAGGGLVLRVLCALRDAGDRLPQAGVLISPWTDLAMTGASRQANAMSDVVISPAAEKRIFAILKVTDPEDPRISPLYANLSGLPPLLIHVSGAEILLDDSVRLADRARAAGVDVTLRVFPGLWHVFHYQTAVPEARKAVKEIGEFGRARLAAATAPVGRGAATAKA